MVKNVSLEEEYDDTKWAFEKMLELLEEWYPAFSTCAIIEDCYKIFELYYEG